MSQAEKNEVAVSESRNTVWEYNGSSFELDLSDLDFAESYEVALANLQEKPQQGWAIERSHPRIRRNDSWAFR